MPASRAVGPLALKLYLFLLFASVGLTEPFLTLYLHRLGLSGAEIGALAAIQPGIAALAPFLWTAWADATGRARDVFLWCSWLVGLLFVPVLLARSWGLLTAALTLFALLKAPLVPLANSLTFQALGDRPQEYGRIRLWGSFGYIVAAVAGGALADRFGIAAVLTGVVIVLLGCGAIASATLRRGEPTPPSPLRKGLLTLLSQSTFRNFLAATFLARLSAGTYNTFFTIQLNGLGVSQGLAGQAWGLGVLCEVGVMAAWPRLMAKVRVERLLSMAIAAHALRWWLIGEIVNPVALITIQLLHGLTFGAFYLASVQIVDRVMIRHDLRAAGQGLYAAAIFGISGMVGNYAAGRFFDAVGLPGLYRLSAIVAAGATLLSFRGTFPSDTPDGV